MGAPIFKDGRPLFVAGVPAMDADCCCSSCAPCPEVDGDFTYGYSSGCDGTHVTFVDTSDIPGCSYVSTEWSFDPPVGITIISKTGRTIVVSATSDWCGEVGMTSNFQCAPGCFCSAVATKTVYMDCLCCQDCESDDKSPATAFLTIGGLSDTECSGIFNPGWCAAANGTYILPKVGPCHWQGGFSSSGLGGDCPWIVSAELTITCNGYWVGGVGIGENKLGDDGCCCGLGGGVGFGSIDLLCLGCNGAYPFAFDMPGSHHSFDCGDRTGSCAGHVTGVIGTA